MELQKRIKNALRIAEGIKDGKIDSKNLYDLLLHLSEADIELDRKDVKVVRELAINDLFLKAINHGYLYREDFEKPGYQNWNETSMKFFSRYRDELDKIGWNSERFLTQITNPDKK